MRRFFLADEQLWHAIAENTTDLSNLLDQEIESVPATGAHTVQQRAKMAQFNQLQRQYQVYTAELRRRYS